MILSFTKCFYRSIINAGVQEGTPLSEAKYTMFTNGVSFLTALATVLYIPHSIYKGYNALAILQSIDAFFVMMVFVLNMQGRHTAARYMFMAVVNSFVLINACVIGYESKVHEFFYICNIIPFLIFPVNQVRNLMAGIVMAVGGYMLYHFMYPYFTVYNLPLADQLNVQHMNVVMKFITFGLAIFMLAWYNYKAESMLAETNEKISAYATDLERSNTDLENFAYVISHDLKAPIKNISSLLKSYLSRFGSQVPIAGNEFLDLSVKSADRLARLIDDMLAYSRIGKNLPAENTVDTNLIVKTIEIELSERLSERNARIEVAQTLPVLYKVHSSMLYHIFQNLVTNGIKFNKSDVPTVIISHEDIGTHYRFKVQDNGIGMKQESTKGLFQMFRRLHTTAEYEGTGIGLAICKRVVGLYNGDIWIDAEQQQGTAFYFDIEKAGIAGDEGSFQFENAMAV
ncbi:MAG: hypothetical protein JST49_07500 [Bacteroidetes bacterium]|nr:hypothetical protein [Bacteroidota bacterium]